MKKDINLFGDKFEKIIFDCQKEESEVRELRQKYANALETLDANNDKRRELLDAIRLAKKKEIDSEIEETKKKMTENEARYAELRKKSCAENGHDYEVVKICFNPTIAEPYGSGSTLDKGIYKVTYECSICGERKTIRQQNQESIFPKNLEAHTNYLGNRLCKSGHTLEDMLSSEYQKLESYLQYLESLKFELCHIFGHSIDKNYVCRCCGEHISRDNYQDECEQAIYKGIAFAKSECEFDQEFITYENGELILSLPAFQDYKNLKRKRVVARVKRK